MELFILYNTDQWCSHNSFDRMGIYSSLDEAVEKATKDASEHSLFDNINDASDFRWALRSRYQAVLKDTGYYIEEEEVSGIMKESNVEKICNLIIEETYNPYEDIIKTDKEILENIRAWAEDYPSWLSESVEYAKGYKAGIIQAKEIVKSFLEEK